MADVVVTFGADDREFNRRTRSMEREHDSRMRRMQRRTETAIRGIERGMVGLTAAVAAGTLAVRGYAEEFSFARREITRMGQAGKTITRGIGRDLFGAIEGASGKASSLADQFERARTSAVNAVSDFFRGMQLGNAGSLFDGKSDAAMVDEARLTREQQDLFASGNAFSQRTRRSAEEELLRIGGDELGATMAGIQNRYRDSMEGFNARRDAGQLTPTQYNELVAMEEKLRDARLASAEATDRQAKQEEAAARAAKNRQLVAGSRAIIDAGRASALRRGGDEFGARKIEIESRFRADMEAARAAGGIEGAFGRANAFAERGIAEADLKAEAAEQKRLLDIDMERGRAAVLRAQGKRDEAEQLEIQLDFAERIREVERNTFLDEQTRASAVRSLESQRDALLGSLTPQARGSGRSVDAGISSTVARFALGRGGSNPAEQTARLSAQQLDTQTKILDGVQIAVRAMTGGLMRA